MLPQRILNKIVQDANGCQVWQGSLQDGYGRVGFQQKLWLVHRLVWTLTIGEIPNGMVLDHLCRNRACCNTDHLRVVTSGENTRAEGSAVGLINGTCRKGIHDVRVTGIEEWNGVRRCRACRQDSRRKAAHRRKVRRANQVLDE